VRRIFMKWKFTRNPLTFFKRFRKTQSSSYFALFVAFEVPKNEEEWENGECGRKLKRQTQRSKRKEKTTTGWGQWANGWHKGCHETRAEDARGEVIPQTDSESGVLGAQLPHNTQMWEVGKGMRVPSEATITKVLATLIVLQKDVNDFFKLS